MKQRFIAKIITGLALWFGIVATSSAQLTISVDMDTVTPGIQNSISVAPGAAFSVDLWATVGAAGLSSYSISTTFDTTELQLNPPAGPAASQPASPGGLTPFVAPAENNALGRVYSFNAGTLSTGPVNTSFIIGSIAFTAPAPVTNGTNDVNVGYFNLPGAIDDAFNNAGVSLAAGTVFNGGTVNVSGSAPTVSAINPVSGTTSGGLSVTITGTDFTGATAVTIGGVAATGVTVVNATTITATTPAHSAGLVNVAVTTPSGTGTGTGMFTYVPLQFNLVGTAGPGLLAGNEPQPLAFPTTASGGEIGAGITYDDAANLLTVTNIGWGSSQGFVNLSSLSNNAHIHGPTPSNNGSGFTQTAGVLFSLTRSSSAVTGGVFTNTPISLTAAQETDLLNGKHYINIHTVNNGGGELRGFLVASPLAPTVNSPTVASITPATATLGGTVTSDGGASITARGVVYSLSSLNANPQIGGANVVNATGSGTTGVFTVNVSSLTASTQYSFAAYATNSTGTTYTSPVSTFTTVAANSEIAVFTGAGTTPANERTDNAGTHDFGSVNVGSSSSAQTFTIQNIGTTDLTGLAVTKGATGTPADFALSALGATTLAPNATTAFTVTFSPSASGARSAVVNIASNDADENPFEINVAGTANGAPTNMALSATSIAENVGANSTVGTLSTTDPNAGNTFTYTLVSGTGSTDNASFNISSASLRISSSPNFEAKSSYAIRVRTTDQGGLFFEKQFTITITNVNETPTDIALSAASIAENVAAGSTVGTMSTTDPDTGNTFTYTLVGGTGSTDNASFTLTTGTLTINASPNFEAKNSYAIRVRTTDQGSLFFEKQFTITITNLAESFASTYDLNKAPGSAADAPNVLAYGAVASDGAGNVVRAGDLNGDGIDDLIIGASGADVGSPLRTDAGAVHVWFGKGALAGTKDAAGTVGTAPELTIFGATAGDTLTTGGALAVGDVNGDGTTDLLLGARFSDGPGDGRTDAGEAYVVFGRKSPAVFPATLDLAVQGSTGADVTLYGATAVDQLTGAGALAVGDVNGDGTVDILLGASSGDGPSDARNGGGEAYIVFGRRSPESFPATLDLAVQGSSGADVTLYGATAGDLLSNGGLAVGDVNGDGTPDFFLGASQADGPADARTGAGEAYVIFGRKSPAFFPATLDLAVQGSSGADVTLYGATGSDLLNSGGALAMGDVNGDGTTDILVGAPGADGPEEGRSLAGETYIVFGRKSPAVFPATLDLGVQGTNGADVTLYGGTSSDRLTSGGALAVGDVNGDGTPDLLLGANAANGPSNSRLGAGEAYIVFGRKSPSVFPATLDLGVQGSTGADVTLYGATSGDTLTSGGALATGDVNGDGITDLLLGAINADGPSEGRTDAGEAYIVFGRKSPVLFTATLDLAVQGSTGANVTLYGATTLDTLATGGAVAAGDVNGDGMTDLLLGANAADGPADVRGGGGEAYVLFGLDTTGGTPELSLQQPVGPENELGNGNTRAFGSVNVGSTADLVFTVRNLGAASLSLTGSPNRVSLGGTDAAQFTVTAQPAASVASLGSTTFTVHFTPASVGAKSATLFIPSNDSDEGNFTIALTGTGTDGTGPTGGTLTLSPLSPFDPSTALTVTFTGWTDPSTPLSYEVLIDNVVVSVQGASASRNITAPPTSGAHTLKGRIYDSLNNATEVTQNFTVNTPQESWRQLHFGSPVDSGNGADTFDFDKDGLVNLIEWAFGLNPTLGSSVQLPQGQIIGGNFVISFTQPPGVSGITYGAEWSTTLAGAGWNSVGIIHTNVSGTHTFSVPIGGSTCLFMRLRVTSP